MIAEKAAQKHRRLARWHVHLPVRGDNIGSLMIHEAEKLGLGRFNKTEAYSREKLVNKILCFTQGGDAWQLFAFEQFE